MAVNQKLLEKLYRPKHNIEKVWFAPKIGFVYKANTTYKKTTLIWSTLAFDIDYPREPIVHPYADVDYNVDNKHQHVFIRTTNVPSYAGLVKLIRESKGRLETTIASFLMDCKEVASSIFADVGYKLLHSKIAQNLNADKATSTDINHAFRLPGYSNKRYIRVSTHRNRITPFHALELVLDKHSIRQLVDYFINAGIDAKAIATCSPLNDEWYKRKHYQIKRQSKVDFISLFKHIVRHYWKPGHRQNLAIRMIGCAYRYITTNEETLYQIFDHIFPKTDEERKKRFDPIFYAKSRSPKIYGLTSLVKYIKKYIDRRFNISKFINQTKQVDGTFYPYAKRGQRKRQSLFEIQQAIMLILLAKANWRQTLEIEYKSFKHLSNEIKHLLRIENQKYAIQSTTLKKALKILQDNQLIGIRYKSRGFIITLNEKDLIELAQRIAYDPIRQQYVINMLYGRIYGSDNTWPEYKKTPSKAIYSSNILITLLILEMLACYEKSIDLIKQALRDLNDRFIGKIGIRKDIDYNLYNFYVAYRTQEFDLGHIYMHNLSLHRLSRYEFDETIRFKLVLKAYLLNIAAVVQLLSFVKRILTARCLR